MREYGYDVAGAMVVWLDWHTEEHPLTAWNACPYEPCSKVSPKLRGGFQ